MRLKSGFLMTLMVLFFVAGNLAYADTGGPRFLFVRSNVMTKNNIDPYVNNSHISPDAISVFTVDYNPVTANHVRDYARLVEHYRRLSAVAPEGVVLFGYSATGKFAARLARDEENVRGLFLLDPVDGAPPMCSKKKFPVFLSENRPTISVPTLIMASEFGEKKWLMNAACVPSENGSEHFASRVTPDALEMIHVEKAGHLDFMNPPMAIVAKMICHPGTGQTDDVVREAALAWDGFIENILRK